MFADLNLELLEAKEKIREGERLQRRIGATERALRDARRRLEDLEATVKKERADVTALEGLSLTALFATVLGNKEQQLQTERQEVLAALLRRDAARDAVAQLKKTQAELVEAFAALGDASGDIRRIMATRESLLSQSGDPRARTLAEITERLAAARGDWKELREAREAGGEAFSCLGKVVSSLESARHWGTWDMIGGGAFSTWIKHGNIDEARRSACDAQSTLDRFTRELADVGGTFAEGIDIGSFLSFADWFFDGLLFDWIVQTRIKESFDKTVAVQHRLGETLARLDRELEGAEERGRVLESERNRLIEGAWIRNCPRRGGLIEWFDVTPVLLIAIAAGCQAEPARGLRQPALSPDGARVAFSLGGDLWVAPAEGGEAERLTAGDADEQKPCWSPDGASIAYSSDADRNRDVYVMRLADRSVRRLTWHTAVDDKPDWSPDGRFIAFQSDREPMVNLSVNSTVFDVWCAPAGGGTAWRVTRFRGENPAWSSDGSALAYDYYSWGYADGEHNVAVMRMENGRPAPGAVPRVVLGGREDSRKPVWKGERLFVAHETVAGTNLWRTRADGGAPIQVTGLADDAVTWPSASSGSSLVVFEHGFRLWAVDTAAATPAPFALDIRIREADRPAAGEASRRTITAGAVHPCWSPDGKAVLVEVEGNLWTLAPDGSSAEVLTRGPEEDTDPAWSPDGRSFVFVRSEPGRPGRLMRWREGSAAPLSPTTGYYSAPAVSPDGRRVACGREVDGAPQIVLVEPDGHVRIVAQQENVLVGWPAFVDDDTLLYAATAYLGGKAESKVLRVSLSTGTRAEVYAAEGILEDLVRYSGDGALAWSLRTAARENPVVQTLRGGAMAAPGGGESRSRFQPTWAPDGRMLLMVESRRTDFRLARYDPAAGLVFRDVDDPAGVLELPLKAELSQTIGEFNRMIFDQVWGTYFREYYDPFHHGASWEAVREKYLPRVTQARTAPERHDWINRMIRELRSSHVALHARPPRGDMATRGLGIDAEVTEEGHLRVAALTAGGPAEAAGIKPGELITAVGETDLTPGADVDRLMTFPSRPVKVPDLAIAVKDRHGDVRTVTPDAVGARELRELRHREGMERRRQRVEEGGRLAYHVIRFMGNSEVTALREALEAKADREALVLDVRDGLGGLAHKQVLQILDSTAPERLDRAPACVIRYRNGRTQLDRYAGGGKGTTGTSWNKPVILIINEVSRSDKEILAHTFRHLKIGYLVGMPTAAGVIGGSDRPLPDGSSITVSVQGWFTTDGRNLEGSGVAPDFLVPFPLEDAYAGRDPQLERAVELLSAQLEGRIPALQRR